MGYMIITQITILNMRVVFLLGLVAFAAATPTLVEPGTAYNYHAKYGIPHASRIKEAEEKITAERESASTSSGGARIVGGSVAPTGAHPYMAGLLITFVNIAGTSACGSSLLSANRLITAAHCWFDGVNQANQYTVVLGSNMLFFDGVRITTNTVFMHPQWFPSLLHNDVAIIYLPTNVAFSTVIQPVAIPADNDQFVGSWSVAAGFGRTSDQQTGITIDAVISHVNLQVISVLQCQAVFGMYVIDSTICTNGAGGVGICGGDSGGPLVVNRNGQTLLVGVSSFVAANGCQLGFPSAFARVTSFRSFIQQHM